MNHWQAARPTEWTEEKLTDTTCYFFTFRLQKVSVNHNQLVQVPASLFQVQSLKKLDFSHNQIKSLAGGNEASETSADVDKWACTSLKVFQLSHNALEHLPVGIYGSTGLVKLFVDHNDLKAFPTAWKCPLVRTALLSPGCHFGLTLSLPSSKHTWFCECY